MILAKNLLLSAIKLPINERVLFESLFTIIPYFYYEIIIRDVVVLEFFLMCSFFYFLYNKKSCLISSVLLGILVYLNPAYVLLLIFLFKNHKKTFVKWTILGLFVFSSLIVASYLYTQNPVS